MTKNMKRKSSVKTTFETLLLDAGLSPKESRVYQVLLEKGTLSAPEIVKASGLKKGITYTVLHKLATEELVLEFERDGKLCYQPTDPRKLKDMIERHKRSMEDVSSRVDALLPELQSTYKLSVGKPTVQYFEGIDGLKTVFSDIFRPKKEPIYGAVDLEQVDSVLTGAVDTSFIPNRLKNKLEVYCVFNDTPHGRALHTKDEKELRHSLLLDTEKYPLPADIESYEDKLALMSFKKGDFIGMIIHNEDFSITVRSLLRFLFDHASECPGLKAVTGKP